MTFIDRVKQIKKEKNITNDDLAAKTGISVSTLGKLLSGHTEEPKLSAAISIAEALDCTLEYLALGKTAPDPLTKAEEMRLAKYRALDAHGVRVCDYILEEEYLRACVIEKAETPAPTVVHTPAKVAKKIRIPLYANRVSAGGGIFLDSSDAETISVTLNEKTKNADFALVVSGNSMEPDYHNGDVLLVDSGAQVAAGDLGIFIGDGEGYFKKFGGDRLLSLNPAYAPIPLSSFSDFSCRGRVIGTLHAKN